MENILVVNKIKFLSFLNKSSFSGMNNQNSIQFFNKLFWKINDIF